MHGILNCGIGHCIVEQVQDEDKLDKGEWFFTSGEDRVFPRGFPVGQVITSQPGAPGMGMRDVKLSLSGQPGGAEAVLVLLEGIHQEIPNGPIALETHVAPLPLPPGEKDSSGRSVDQVQTEADKLVGKYEELGKAQNHVYGAIGSNIPNFNPPKPSAIIPPSSSNVVAKTDENKTTKKTMADAKSDVLVPVHSVAKAFPHSSVATALLR